MYKKILVPLDGSWRAEAILRHVQDLARIFDAEVVFLQVIEPPQAIFDAYETLVELYTAEIKDLEDQAQKYLTARQNEFQKLGVRCRSRIARGPVVKNIIDAAMAEEADLIAMASHGRSGLANVFYGSVALGVLHRADRPLLLVRSGGERTGG